MHAQTDPQTSRLASSSAFTCARVDVRRVFDRDFDRLEPPFLEGLKSFVLSLVNGEVKRKVLMPILIV